MYRDIKGQNSKQAAIFFVHENGSSRLGRLKAVHERVRTIHGLHAPIDGLTQGVDGSFSRGFACVYEDILWDVLHRRFFD